MRKTHITDGTIVCSVHFVKRHVAPSEASLILDLIVPPNEPNERVVGAIKNAVAKAWTIRRLVLPLPRFVELTDQLADLGVVLRPKAYCAHLVPA